jgi:tetraacyldisaccharide 4'-kinase
VPPLAALIWSAGATAAAPALGVMLRRRAAAGKEIAARLPERRGIDSTPRPARRLLWLHAASVGEAVSALPVLSALPPEIFTIFTTGTVTSARLLETRLPELRLSGRVMHRFVPLDVPQWARRFLKHWRPDAACFLESELWPNMLAACHRQGVPVALINARFSERSAASWARAPGLARYVLQNFAWIAAQSAADAARLRALGAIHVEVLGNLKLAAPVLPAHPDEVNRLTALAGDRPRWLAASTHPADDAVVARVHRALLARHSDLLTAVAPRHPERGAEVAAAMGGAPRRSLGEDFAPGHGAWVCDTMGEMGLLYRVFPTVFMGKSFAPGGGGQNFLEPARLGCAVATGPYTENFAEARAMAEAAGALTVVETEDALIDWLGARLQTAHAATALERDNDLPHVIAARLVGLLSQLPYKQPVSRQGFVGQPAFWRHGSGSPLPALLAPAAHIVAAATARRLRRPGWQAPVPVICCGNAVVGGAGKTTLVLDLAHRLRARGLDVHLLTRGYRGSAEGVMRVDPARHAASEVGDEALLLAAAAPTWRGADRADTARQAVAAGAEVLVMDDGLQNPTLEKTLSLLVIDGGFGVGNGRVLPAGPLREPVDTAASRCRAAVLIGPDAAGALAQIDARLPVLRARLQPEPGLADLAGQRVLAFAGIGRPEKFFAMLIEAGVEVTEQIAFPDHHAFTAAELADILARAAGHCALAVTTPKDLVRIPAAMHRQIRAIGVSLAWESETALAAMLEPILPSACLA